MNSLIAAEANWHKATSFRNPTPEDGNALHRLIENCPPLDPNSRYCNLLQCSHFSDTSIIAENSFEMVGFVSGYIVPKREDTLFIWQVAVIESSRGEGLAKQMLLRLLNRPACRNVHYLETTITEDNNASKTLFTKLAEYLGVNLTKSPLFLRDIHFDSQHADEILFRMGPFNTSKLSA